MEFRAIKVDRDNKHFFEVINPGGGADKSVGQFLETLLSRGYSIRTIRAYAFDLADFYNWLISEDLSLKELDKLKLHRYIDFQSERELSPRTINRRLITAGAFYRFHFHRDLPAGDKYTASNPYYKGQVNPWAMGMIPRRKGYSKNLHVKAPKKLIDPLTQDEVSAFIRGIKRYRDLAIINLMWQCGLRSLEVLLLKTKDIDLLENQICVWGKGDKERKLPLSPNVSSLIQKYVYYERPKLCKSEELFVILKGKRRGKPMTREGLRRLFRYRRKTSGVSRANPHRFRHGFGSEMIRGGISVEALKRLMGHTDIRQTMGYVNLDMSYVRDEFEKAMQRLKEIHEKKENKKN